MSTVTVLELMHKPSLEELGRIFEEHYDLVYRTAYSITRTPQDAEDVAQSTFVRALLLASSARVPTSTLILATHLSQSLIGCCAIAGAASQASEARATSIVIIRVIRFTSPLCETCAQLRRRSDDGSGVSDTEVERA